MFFTVQRNSYIIEELYMDSLNHRGGEAPLQGL